MIQVLALALVLTADPANAEGAAGSVKEIPLAVQVSREFVTREMWDSVVEGAVTQYAALFRAEAERNGGTADAGLEGALRRLYDEQLPYGEVIDLQASLLEKHFTAEELVQVRDFYRTPLGKKLRDRMPEMQKDAVGLTLQKVSMERIGAALRPHFHAPASEEGRGSAEAAPPRAAGEATGGPGVQGR